MQRQQVQTIERPKRRRGTEITDQASQSEFLSVESQHDSSDLRTPTKEELADKAFVIKKIAAVKTEKKPSLKNLNKVQTGIQSEYLKALANNGTIVSSSLEEPL